MTSMGFCASTNEVIDSPLALHAVICVFFRTLQALLPFLGSQPQVLWSSRETRGFTSSNGKNINL